MQNVINMLNETINGMSKMEYAQAVATEVNGEVREVSKANGITRLGVCLGDGDVRPTIYIDEMYEKNLSVDDAVAKVRELYANAYDPTNDIDLNNITSYEATKGKLRLRLYNKTTKAEVFQSAKKYGFDDLILVPYVEIGKSPEGDLMSTKVTKQLLTSWGVTKTKVINDAMRNSKEFGGYKVNSMRDTLIEMMGEGAAMMLPPETDETPQMLTVLSKDKTFGALGAIICAKELNERFKGNGYFIIPSSVHEVIAVPRTNMSAEDLARMIREVNEGQVAPEERLSDHAYEFEGVA